MVDATEVIEQSEQEKQEVYSYVDEVAEYFIDRVGELFEADEAVQDVSDEFGVSQRVASQILRELYSDIVDPVVRVPRGGTFYVGVVEYVERDGWYGYVHYDDVDGKTRRGVCAKDVLEGVKDSEVGYADRDPSVGWDEIDEVFEEYYNDAYPDVVRSEVEVEVGASLLSGTTVGGNTVSIDGHDHTGETINPNTVNTKRLDSTDFIAWDGDGDVNSFLSNAGGGSTVYIPAGTYQNIRPEEGQTVIASRDAVFDGDGSDATLRLNQPDARVMGGKYKNSNDEDSIRFASENCVVDNVVVESSGRHGVFFGSSDNKNMISSFVISEVPGTEILVLGDDNKISNGRVDGNIDNSGSNNAVDNDSIVFL